MHNSKCNFYCHENSRKINMYRLSIMLYKNYIIQDNLKKSRSRHSSLIYRNSPSLAQYILSRKPERLIRVTFMDPMSLFASLLPKILCAKYYDSNCTKQKSSWIKWTKPKGWYAKFNFFLSNSIAFSIEKKKTRKGNFILILFLSSLNKTIKKYRQSFFIETM